MRQYASWLEAAGPDVVFRHDIDYDVAGAHELLAIERAHGVRSHVYVNHRLTGGIAELVAAFPEMHYGLHVLSGDRGEYEADLAALREVIEPESVSAHQPRNSGAVKLIEEVPLPDAPNEGTRMSDGGGALHTDDPPAWIAAQERAHVLTHPVHWHQGRFLKRMMGESLTRFDKHRHLLPKWFRVDSPVVAALPGIIEPLVAEDRLHVVVDAGCGVGLLARALLPLSRVKYRGIDIEEEYIEAGRKVFDLCGYGPALEVGDIRESDLSGDVLVFTGYEDYPFDHAAFDPDFRYLVISIVTEGRYRDALRRGKEYDYIAPEDFLAAYPDYTVRDRHEVAGRFVYVLERRE